VPAGEPVYLDVPVPNGPAVGLPENFGIRAVLRTARTYTGPAPRIELERVFGVTTFELG
jgi:hypothetical protein